MALSSLCYISYSIKKVFIGHYENFRFVTNFYCCYNIVYLFHSWKIFNNYILEEPWLAANPSLLFYTMLFYRSALTEYMEFRTSKTIRISGTFLSKCRCTNLYAVFQITFSVFGHHLNPLYTVIHLIFRFFIIAMITWIMFKSNFRLSSARLDPLSTSIRFKHFGRHCIFLFTLQKPHTWNKKIEKWVYTCLKICRKKLNCNSILIQQNI